MPIPKIKKDISNVKNKTKFNLGKQGETTMLNNQEQQQALNTFTQFIDTLAERSARFAASQESPAPEKVTEEEQNAYINMMTDLVFTNPYVFVRTTSEAENADLYHYHEATAYGAQHPLAILCTDETKKELGAYYKAVPFVEILETIIADPSLEATLVNPSEKHKYVLLKENVELFLQFKLGNIEFIGF